MADVEFNQEKSYRVETLDTDKQRLARLNTLFRHRKLQGEFFLPDNNFYSLTLVDKASALMEWLGIESDEKVYVDFSNEIQPAGLYFYENGTHYILINAKKAGSTVQSAAVLAHELMHFVLLGVFKYRLEETSDNERFTDIATVFCGFGVVVTNGFQYDSGWFETIAALMFGALRIHTQSLSFGYYKPKEYAKMVSDFGKSFEIKPSEYAGYFLPWSRHFLPANIRTAIIAGAQKSDTAIVARKQVIKSKLIMVGILVLLVPVAIGFFYLLSVINGNGSSSSLSSQQQQQLSSLQSTVNSDKAAYTTCSAQLSNEQSQVNTSSQTAVNQYNSSVNACINTRSEYSAAVKAYNNYLNQHQ